jgi:hypothetical protein
VMAEDVHRSGQETHAQHRSRGDGSIVPAPIPRVKRAGYPQFLFPIPRAGGEDGGLADEDDHRRDPAAHRLQSFPERSRLANTQVAGCRAAGRG